VALIICLITIPSIWIKANFYSVYFLVSIIDFMQMFLLKLKNIPILKICLELIFLTFYYDWHSTANNFFEY